MAGKLSGCGELRTARRASATAMAQEEAGELLTGLTQAANGDQTSARDRGSPHEPEPEPADRRQFAGPMQPGQLEGVAPVGLDPFSWFAPRNQRRSHDDALMRNKAVYIALGVQADGTKDILGLWIENTEGAKFWLRVMNELKNRGVSDVLIAVIDGLKGFPEAINAVFPQTIVQTCIVHLIRHSMDFASWKDRKVLAGALKAIYRAKDADAAKSALEAFDTSHWGEKYPAIAQSWRRNWERVIPFFAFPEAVRRIIYTTNAIEALNAKLRRAVRTRGHFPTDDAATKLLFLVLRQAAGERKTPPRQQWFPAKTQFAIMFDERYHSKRDGATGPAHKILDTPPRSTVAESRE